MIMGMGLAMANPLGNLAAWITDVIEALGYVGVAMLIALENVFPPIPSEAILPLSGFLAGQGRFWLPLVVLAATVGSVMGALVLYGISRWLGEERVRRLVTRYGRWLTIGEEDLDRAQGWFDRHGSAVVFLGRLVPVVRSLVSIPAGVERMPLGRFTLYTALGSGLWNVALIGLGWVLGDRWEVVRSYTRVLEYGVLALLVGAIVWFLRRRWTTAREGEQTSP